MTRYLPCQWNELKYTTLKYAHTHLRHEWNEWSKKNERTLVLEWHMRRNTCSFIHFSWCTHDKWFIILNVKKTDVPCFKISSYIEIRCSCVYAPFSCLDVCVCVYVNGRLVPIWFRPAWDKEMNKVLQYIYLKYIVPVCVHVCLSVCVCICSKRVTRFSFFLFVLFRCQ